MTTPDDAAQALAGLEPVRAGVLRSVRSKLAIPLVAWGVAWVVGGLAMQYLPHALGAWVGSACMVAAMLTTWIARDQQIRTGMEERTAAAWFVVFLSSPFLIIIVNSADRILIAVLMCGLWGMCLTLYGVAGRDRPLAAAGAVILVAGAAGRVFAPAHAIAIVGVVGGLAMVGLGVSRVRWRP